MEIKNREKILQDEIKNKQEIFALELKARKRKLHLN